VASVHACRKAEEPFPCLQGHDHLLEGGVAGPFADSVDRDLRLASAGFQTGEGVGGGHAEIVVAVDGDDGVVDTTHLCFKAGNGLGEL